MLTCKFLAHMCLCHQALFGTGQRAAEPKNVPGGTDVLGK